MNRLAVALIGLLIGAAVAVVTTLSTTALPSPRSYEASAPEEPTPAPAPGSTLEPMATLPSLTQAQRQRAVDIVLGSEAVGKLIEGHPRGVTRVDPLIGPDGNVIGAVVYIAFDSPQTISGTWYASSVPCGERGASSGPEKYYEPAPVVATWEDLESVWVWVDFHRGSVYTILPGDGGKLVGREMHVPGKPTPAICGE